MGVEESKNIETLGEEGAGRGRGDRGGKEHMWE